MKVKKISMNIPMETYIELNREAKVIGAPLSSLILLKLAELKKQQQSKDLLSDLLNNGDLKKLIEIYDKSNKNE